MARPTDKIDWRRFCFDGILCSFVLWRFLYLTHIFICLLCMHTFLARNQLIHLFLLLLCLNVFLLFVVSTIQSELNVATTITNWIKIKRSETHSSLVEVMRKNPFFRHQFFFARQSASQCYVLYSSALSSVYIYFLSIYVVYFFLLLARLLLLLLLYFSWFIDDLHIDFECKLPFRSNTMAHQHTNAYVVVRSIREHRSTPLCVNGK